MNGAGVLMKDTRSSETEKADTPQPIKEIHRKDPMLASNCLGEKGPHSETWLAGLPHRPHADTWPVESLELVSLKTIAHGIMKMNLTQKHISLEC